MTVVPRIVRLKYDGSENLLAEVPQHRPRIALAHTLTNEGLWDVELAPRAIIMLPLGPQPYCPAGWANGMNKSSTGPPVLSVAVHNCQ